MQCYLGKFSGVSHVEDRMRIKKCFVKQFSLLKTCPAHQMLHCSTSSVYLFFSHCSEQLLDIVSGMCFTDRNSWSRTVFQSTAGRCSFEVNSSLDAFPCWLIDNNAEERICFWAYCFTVKKLARSNKSAFTPHCFLHLCFLGYRTTLGKNLVLKALSN